MSCSNNMKQIGLAILNFEASHKLLPSGGKASTRGPTETVFARQSLFTYLLPYLEKQNIYNQIALGRSYRDITAGAQINAPNPNSPTGYVQGNVAAALTNIHTFVSPSNPFSAQDVRNPAGFGGTDYAATVYTDIGPNGVRNRPTRMDGTLTVTGGSDATGSSVNPSGYVNSSVPTSVPISAVADGTSNTIAVIEDAGHMAPWNNPGANQVYYTLSVYPDTFTNTGNMLTNDVTDVNGGQELHSSCGIGQNSDATGSGVSGPRDAAVHGGERGRHRQH